MGNTCSTRADDQDLETEERNQELSVRDSLNSARKRPKSMKIVAMGQKQSRDKGSNGETSSDDSTMSEGANRENRTPRDKKLRKPGDIFGRGAHLTTSSTIRPREMTFAPETSNDTLSSPYLKHGPQMREMTFNKTPILSG